MNVLFIEFEGFVKWEMSKNEPQCICFLSNLLLFWVRFRKQGISDFTFYPFMLFYISTTV